MYQKLANHMGKILKVIDDGTANPAKVQRALVVAVQAICQNLADEYEPVQDRGSFGDKPVHEVLSDLFGGNMH